MTSDRKADIAAFAAILLAGALSVVWVFLVPIFQAPDEPAHFDYAMSIYSAHRLVRVSDGRPGWIVSPYTKYLMRATDWERVAWHSSMRAPRGYGSRAYFERVDAEAPNAGGGPPRHGVSYITPLYPFGFYGLEALWMRAASLFTESLVARFFAARLLCVFLTMLGLYFNYRTALNLGIPRWTSVALVAAVAFFPLTTFVSSYVQPDNLAYALVSAALFFASRLPRGSPSLTTLAGLGLSLGLLAITKYHVFLAAAIPLLSLAFVRLAQSSMTTLRRLQAIALTIVPAIALLMVQYLAVNRSVGHASTLPTDMGSDYLRTVLALGIGPTIKYVGTSVGAAFVDCFVTGGCAATFWQMIGWVDTPIVIVNPQVELWIRVVIAFMSLTAATTVIFFTCRNGLRLMTAGLRGHVRAALNALVGAPDLNSYLSFAAIMIILYVVTDNAFGMEGRQWYPYIFPAFLCFVWYVPRGLRKHRPHVSAVLACMVLVYSLVASAYAASDLARRYYGSPGAQYAVTSPPPSQISHETDGVLWPVVSAEYHVNARQVPFTFASGARLLAGGSALMPGLSVLPSSVAVLVDGHVPLAVLANQYLFPVAESTHSIADGYSGFYASFSTANMREGPHIVSAFAQAPHGAKYDPIPPTRLFFVARDGIRFSLRTLKQLANLPVVPGALGRKGSCNHGVALLAGRLSRTGPHHYAAAWLLVDDRPYPARFDETSASFEAAVPTLELPAGAHRVTGYAIDESARAVRIGQSTTIQTGPDSRTEQYLADPPAACTDSLVQLEES